VQELFYGAVCPGGKSAFCHDALVSPPPADRALLDEAVALAREAGQLTLRWFRSNDLVVDRKGDGTPVTEADRASERFVRTYLAKAHPDDSVLGEEEDDTVGSSGRSWIIDPVDGTKAFTHGVPLYSTLLAVEDEHGPAVGVIELPALGQTVYAGRGLGCFADDVPARVSTRDRLAGSYLTTSGFDYWDESVLLAVRRSGLVMRTWGDGYGYALVATGRVEAMVDPVAARWDVAAMPVLLSEAGGRFTDLRGNEGSAGGSGLATNGLLHDELLAVVTPFSTP
jgi:histidinol phosphatase-like enzyme (inositol monophosphatase family)